MPATPSTDLTVVITDKDGRTKSLHGNAPHPGDRPQGLQFGTQQGNGFTTCTFTLSNPIDRERDDLHGLDDVGVYLASGDKVWEGFIASMPRSTSGDGQATLTVTCAGYIALTQATFRQVFVDRDISAWGPTSTARRVSLLSNYGTVHDPSTTPDQSGRPTLRLGLSGAWAAGAKPIAEAVYDAGPNSALGQVTATGTRGQNVLTGDANWAWGALLSPDDLATAPDSTGDLHAAGPVPVSLTTTSADRRFAFLQLSYESAGAAGVDGQEYAVDFSDVAVYGSHGLPLIGATAPYGVAASDVIRWLIDTCCPQLSSAGVTNTTLPIMHLPFRDRTTVFAAIQKVNSYHLFNYGCWENRTFHYAPVDLTDWDWEIRHDEVGNQIGLQGDEYVNLRRGLVVQFQNVATGATEELLPKDYPELRDDSIDNPMTAHGWPDTIGEPFVVPYPTTLGNALELGRIRLLEDNQVKAPGSFTVQHRIKDRAGVWQPVSKVRAGERVRLTSSLSLSDRPRPITETSFSDNGTVTLAVDSEARVLEALLDRTSTALIAAGLS